MVYLKTGVCGANGDPNECNYDTESVPTGDVDIYCFNFNSPDKFFVVPSQYASSEWTPTRP